MPCRRTFQQLRSRLPRVLRDNRGATAIEYGLIVAMIVIAMIVALKNLAGTTIGMWNNVSTKVDQAS
ncbi:MULTISPECIES: Flp family type IVb pilin [unclassified Sphingomonas]|jgi:pilus assembly protein Flp/PilA|uniref:Flp family type IVb pilin n=1 Tax=unclassified Sphingomonas TaxID=196159 RepID=UPI00226ACBD1|nr:MULTISPECIES: Flp family type IVb pilin [unclassified Sphingomonas]